MRDKLDEIELKGTMFLNAFSKKHQRFIAWFIVISYTIFILASGILIGVLI